MTRKPLTEEQKAKRLEQMRKWRAANKDKVNASCRRYRQSRKGKPRTDEQKAKALAYQRKWKAANAEHVLESKRRWIAANLEHVRAYSRRKSAEARANKPRHAPMGERLHKSLSQNTVWLAANAVVPCGLPRDVREDVLSMIVLAVLEGEIKLEQVPDLAREFTNRHYRQFSKFDTVSLDEPIFYGDRKTLLDTLTTDNAVLM